MTVFGYTVVAVAGSVAGAVWGAVFVDFVPEWYERLHPGLQALLFFLPLALHFCCSLVFRWWKWQHCFLYGAVVLAWWIPGEVSNELKHVGNLSHFGGLGRQVTLYATTFLVIALAWLLGRWLRRRVSWFRD